MWPLMPIYKSKLWTSMNFHLQLSKFLSLDSFTSHKCVCSLYRFCASNVELELKSRNTFFKFSNSKIKYWSTWINVTQQWTIAHHFNFLIQLRLSCTFLIFQFSQDFQVYIFFILSFVFLLCNVHSSFVFYLGFLCSF